MMHTVSVYERIPGFRERLDDRSQEQYNQSVTQLLNDGVEWVDDIIESNMKRQLKEDLKKIVELRDQRQKS